MRFLALPFHCIGAGFLFFGMIFLAVGGVIEGDHTKPTMEDWPFKRMN